MACIAGRIREARKLAGMTQVQLASAVGISRSYLAGVERGRYNPSVKVLVAIAEFYSMFDIEQIAHRKLMDAVGDFLIK